MIPVWTYWEGPRPAWIELCLETMRLHIPTLRVITRDDWEAMCPPICRPPRLAEVTPNQRSNFVRAWLLKTHGGIWVDADCIVFRDLRPLFEHTSGDTFVAYRAPPWNGTERVICSALVASQSNGRVAVQWVSDLVATLLTIPGKDLADRNSLGPRILWGSLRDRGNLCILSSWQVSPIRWVETEKMLAERDDSGHARQYPFIERGAYCCMLSHDMLGPLRSQSREELLGGRSLASWLFRQALERVGSPLRGTAE